MTYSITSSRAARTIAVALLALVIATTMLAVSIAGNRDARSGNAAYAAGVSAAPLMSARAFLPDTSAQLAKTSSIQHSIELNGAGAHVEVGDAEQLRLADQFTLEAWIRPASVTSHRHIVGKNYYELSVDPAPGGWRASIEVRSGGRWYTAASGALKPGSWYHVAGTYDGSELRVYVNGEMRGSTPAAGPVDSSSRPLRIGSADGRDDFFHGAIDEVRVSSTVRYTKAFAVPATEFADDAQTAGLWHLNEGSGDRTADASAGSRQGVLVSGPKWITDAPWQAAPLPPAPTTAPATAVPATATAVPATATAVPATATAVPATATKIPPTATGIPVVTPTAVPTPVDMSQGLRGITHKATGSLGYSDVGTHQLVRTSGNRVYIFAPEIYKNYVRVLRADNSATPSGFAEADAANRLQANSTIWAVDAAIDSRDVVHVLYIAEAGEVVYTTFDTTTDSWGKPATIAASRWPNRNNDLRQGSSGIGIALDAAGVAHVVYSKTENGSRRVYYNSSANGAWKNERRVDELAGNDNSHPVLAFAPDGTLYVAWLTAADGNRGAVAVRALREGAWAAQTLVDDKAFANQGYSIDQGPSLSVGPDGTVHVVYIGPYEQVLNQPSRYEYGRTLHRHSSDGGRSWTADHPPLRYTHNPSLWIDPQGNLAIFGHREYWLGERCASMLVTVRPAGGSWTTWRVFADGCFDASVSTRWAQFHRVAPDVLDALYWTEKGPNGESDMNQLYYAEVRGGVDALLALPPAPER